MKTKRIGAILAGLVIVLVMVPMFTMAFLSDLVALTSYSVSKTHGDEAALAWGIYWGGIYIIASAFGLVPVVGTAAIIAGLTWAV